MTVQIALERGSSWIGRVIRWVTQGRVNHAYFIVQPQNVVYEATAWGFVRNPLGRRKDTRYVVDILYPYNAEDAGKLDVWVGRPYDYIELFYNLFLTLAERIKLKLLNPFRSSKALFCSESVVRWLRGIGFPGAWKLDTESTDPEELLAFLQASKYARVTETPEGI
jgi:hypothetical protein